MAVVRPAITVYNLDGTEQGQVASPAVFGAPIRSDVVNIVHTNMAKNTRQAHAVSPLAGMQHSAESWGTGRAVSRIPRVSGSGTNRSGQGAFGNMCRKGRMASPIKIWRRWHRKTSISQKRYAVASALAASAVTSLVLARGHNVSRVEEIPLVLDNAFESVTKTKLAIQALKAVGAGGDLARCADTRKVRTGTARIRNRTHSVRRGPLVVYANDHGITKAVRNLPGVETLNVNRLNLLKLAPGGTIGRFIVWTKGAIESLNKVFGTTTVAAEGKKGFKVPFGTVTNPDISRIINSDEIQAVVRAPKKNKKAVQKRNPLTNFSAKAALNPYATVLRKAEREQHEKNRLARIAKKAELAKKAAAPKKK